MKNSVIIKGNKYGIVVIFSEDATFEELKSELIEKFKAAAKFFEKANLAISFEGRKLSAEEEKEILDVISANTDLNIVCVVDTDAMREQYFKKAVEEKMEQLSKTTGQFYKGTLRSGQFVESESSLVILGDVNPGANVTAKGNVVILGALKGNVYAGAGGNEDAFVFALEMAPIQIRIAETIARCNDSTYKSKISSKSPMIAFAEGEDIYIEKYDKDIIDDIRL